MTAKQKAKLSEATIAKIAATDRRQEIPAGHGLYLTVQPTGAKSWALRYRRPGAGMAKVILGPWPETTLKEARQKAREELVEVGKGNDPAAAKRDRRAAQRPQRVIPAAAGGEIGDAVAKFLTAYAKTHRSADQVQEYLDRFAVPAWSGKKLSEITALDVRKVVYTFADEKPTAANRLLAALKVFFGWATDRGLILVSPAAGVKKPSAEKSRDRYLDDVELADLLRVLDGEPYPFGAILKLLVYTGLRRNEIACATRGEIDLDKKLWSIPRARTKTDKTLVVPITEPVAEIIRSIPIIDNSPHLFPAQRGGGRATVSGFSRAKLRIDAALAELRAASGVNEPMEGWTIHDLRRSVASGLQRLRFPVEIAEAVLGHSSGTRGGIAGVYARHDYAEEKKAALEAWARHLDALLHPTARAKVIRLR